MKRIIEAYVGPYPTSFLDPMPTVKVKYNDGDEETLFSFYPDEISFTSNEFIGLTRDEAGQLRHKRDVAFLQS